MIREKREILVSAFTAISDPKNNQLIILDLESPTTYRKLNEVSIEVIKKLKQYLQINENLYFN